MDSIEAARELPLPDDCKRLVAKFLRHPTADLIYKLRFYSDCAYRYDYSTLSIFGDDLPKCTLAGGQIYCKHNYWSGEPVDCHGALRLQGDGRIHCYSNGQVSTWGYRPHPPQLNMPPRYGPSLELESSDDE